MTRFDLSREVGRAGERLVASFARRRGCGVIASYDFAGTDGQKAPRILFENAGLVIPDLDAARGGRRMWIEVKTLSDAAYNRRYGMRVHGIKCRHRNDYLAVEAQTGTPVFLAVLEVQTGGLLMARLSSLQRYDCICDGCARAGETLPDHLIYFRRGDFTLTHVFSSEDLAPLREAMSGLRSSGGRGEAGPIEMGDIGGAP